MPFGLNTQQQLSWLNHHYKSEINRYQIPEDQLLLTAMQSHYQDLDLRVIPFVAGGTGGQMGGWFKEKIPEDAESFVDYANSLPSKKFRFRIAGLGGEIIKQGSDQIEIYDYLGKQITDELESGHLDAAEWIGPFEDTAIALNLVPGIKYYYYPGWWDPGTTYELVVNLKAWEDLPPQFKHILKAACREACQAILAFYAEENSKVLQDLSKKISLQRFPAKLLETMRRETNNVLNRRFGLESKIASRAQRELFVEWQAYQQRMKDWYRLVDSERKS